MTSKRWRKTAAIAGVVVVAVVVLDAYLLDGVFGRFWTAIGAAPTEFAAGYSDESFRRIKAGMTTDDVKQLLGAPLFITLKYSNGEILQFEGLSGKPHNGFGAIVSLLTKDVARAKFGDPQHEGWAYSRSPTTSPYSFRSIGFERGRVVDVAHGLGGW